MKRKMIWVEVNETIHAQFKPILKAKGRDRGVKYLEQKTLGDVLNRYMKRVVERGDKGQNAEGAKS